MPFLQLFPRKSINYLEHQALKKLNRAAQKNNEKKRGVKRVKRHFFRVEKNELKNFLNTFF